MIRRATALRRIVASGNKLYNKKSNARSFHTTGVMAGDALDMADTFARRHSKFIQRRFSTIISVEYCF